VVREQSPAAGEEKNPLVVEEYHGVYLWYSCPPEAICFCKVKTKFPAF